MSYIGKHLSALPSPALVLDRERFRRNCERMLAVARESGVQLRGQTKTHKTVEGGVLQVSPPGCPTPLLPCFADWRQSAVHCDLHPGGVRDVRWCRLR